MAETESLCDSIKLWVITRDTGGTRRDAKVLRKLDVGEDKASKKFQQWDTRLERLTLMVKLGWLNPPIVPGVLYHDRRKGDFHPKYKGSA